MAIISLTKKWSYRTVYETTGVRPLLYRNAFDNRHYNLFVFSIFYDVLRSLGLRGRKNALSSWLHCLGVSCENHAYIKQTVVYGGTYTISLPYAIRKSILPDTRRKGLINRRYNTNNKRTEPTERRKNKYIQNIYMSRDVYGEYRVIIQGVYNNPVRYNCNIHEECELIVKSTHFSVSRKKYLENSRFVCTQTSRIVIKVYVKKKINKINKMIS